MAQYVAFLRGVNVGGHNRLNMKELCKCLEAAGLESVSSYMQSGNIIFEASGDPDAISELIRNEIRDTFKCEVEPVLRTGGRIREIVRNDPFKEIETTGTKQFVTFISGQPSKKIIQIKIPPGKDVEIVLIEGGDVFTRARMKNDRYGVPNTVIEAIPGIRATTRNWATVKGVAQKLYALPR